uniref:Non-structural protein 1 n=1 Tax=Human rotavirus A TaxID=10941 RepID=B1PYP8_9REOV|nr:NSP1 [Human rotavirus A]ACA96841.1 NSP1 [Human rotavirus A]
MATFKDACFFYKKLNRLNNQVLKLGANSVWRPAPLSKYKGWCLDCCQHTDLTYCKGCSLYHVCQWCSQYARCFLDNQPHLLRMRTLKEPITKEDICNLVSMYSILFPINDKVVRKFSNNVRQHKCRNEYEFEWYNQLLFPITLQALTIKIDDSVYHIFGYYDDMTKVNQTPFSFTNLINRYDKLLLDSINFDRMANLPGALQHQYALRYFSKSRFISHGIKDLCKSHFTEETLENKEIPTSPYELTRNCTVNLTPYGVMRWNDECKKMVNANDYISEMNTSYTEHYTVSQQNLIFVEHKLNLLSKRIQPNYVASNHSLRASKMKKCKWCALQPSTFWDDFRLSDIYDLIMEFIRVLVKSNVNVGHCSSNEWIYPHMQNIFNPCRTQSYNFAINKLFEYLESVEVDGTEYIMFDNNLTIELYDIIRSVMRCRVPSILSKFDVATIIKAIISKWFNIDRMRKVPLTLMQTSTLRNLNSSDDLIDEYALMISDDED